MGFLLGDLEGNRPAFRRPETSWLKTSFHQKISLRIATGNSHPVTGNRSTSHTYQNKNPRLAGALVLVISRGIEPLLPGWKPGVLTVRRRDHSDMNVPYFSTQIHVLIWTAWCPSHVPRPRNFVIENKFSSEGFLANCHRQFSP